ncbi:BnaA09g15840D [Brassica napus]|uniref:BnaA09g15840D protein n=1 Tax=Brassica napus TaxID=3708 RepID=A0A078HYC7_BRANA|nr:BnaA09g15840D [Brassica napus]
MPKAVKRKRRQEERECACLWNSS